MTTEIWLHLQLLSSVLWELASRSLKVIATFFQITVSNDWDVGSQLRRQLKEHHYIYTVACVFLSLWLLLSCRVLTDVLRCDWGRHCHYPLVDHEAWFNFHSHKASKRLEFGLLFLCPGLLGCPAFPTSYKYLWWLILIANLKGFEIPMETNLCACLWGIIQITLTGGGGPFKNVGSTIVWAEFGAVWKGES